MKTNFITILLALITFNAIAQELSFVEDRNIDLNKNYSLASGYLKSGFAIDNNGNKIISGGFDGVNVDFGTSNLISSERNRSAFVAKYDTEDNLIWLKKIGGGIFSFPQSSTTYVSDDYVTDVSVDSQNNIYVLASIEVLTNEVVDLDPEHPTTNSIIATNTAGSGFFNLNKDLFLIKYSPNGKLLWYKVIKDDFNDESLKLHVSANDSVFCTGYLGGYTGSSIDFDASQSYADDRDKIQGEFLRLGFIAQYNSDGDFISVNGLGGSATVSDIHVSTTSSSSENRYASGSFSGAQTSLYEGLYLFKNSENPVYVTSLGTFEFLPQNEDIFILKYKNNGEILWVNTISSTSQNRVLGMVVDQDENVFVSGYFSGNSVDFDKNDTSSSNIISASAQGSAFIAKYNAADGSLNWIKKVEGSGVSLARDLAIKDDKIVLGGEFKGSVTIGGLDFDSIDFNPFIAVIDTNGNWISAGEIDKTEHSSVAQVVISDDGTINYLGFEAESITSALNNIKKMFIGKVDNLSVLSVNQPGIVDSGFSIAPNPTSNYISIQFPEVKRKININIYNSLGQILFSKQYVNTQSESLDISTFNQGHYILSIEENGIIVSSTKIIKT